MYNLARSYLVMSANRSYSEVVLEEDLDQTINSFLDEGMDLVYIYPLSRKFAASRSDAFDVTELDSERD